MKQFIAEGKDVNFKNIVGGTVLMNAARYGDLEIVKLLLGKGANVHAKTDAGGTALMDAAEHGNYHIVMALLESGAEVNATEEDGWTPLICGAWGGNEMVVEALLNADAEINVQCNMGTPVVVAAKRKQAACVLALLKAGAEWDDLDSSQKEVYSTDYQFIRRRWLLFWRSF